MSTIIKIAGTILSGTALATTPLLPARTIEIRITPQERQATNIEIIAEIARANGIEPIHLYGIAAQESSFGKLKIGDNGCSNGWYHINICANSNAKEVIGDLKKETKWVADRLNYLGYQIDSRRAIAAYNRPSSPNYKYADLVEKRINEIEKFIGTSK